ncbi:putative short-chain dehydrogenase [Xylariomycetidae sp. FL0641]|nr:putative short-chain dehydrogenase [Xylariomycetidae sp. FL0641]
MIVEKPASPKGSILLTGANGGLGVAVVRALTARPDLARGYHGVYTVREPSRATDLHGALASAAPHAHPHEVLPLDLTRLADVRRAAADLNGRVARGELPPFRALVLNAAFLEFTEQTWTEEGGFDSAFAAAYLGHWLLTMLLLQSLDRENGRIVVIASSAHDSRDPRNNAGGQYKEEKWHTIFHDSTEPIAKGGWSSTQEDPSFRGGYRRYGAAKLCQVMMVPELQRRLSADPALQNISVLAIDPGSTPTGLVRRGDWRITGLWTYIMPWLVVFLTWLWPNGGNRTTAKSARDILAAAFDCNPVLGERPRGLYLNGTDLSRPAAEARDPRKREVLWRDTLRYTQLRGEETALRNWS